jgi:hypothetical protein
MARHYHLDICLELDASRLSDAFRNELQEILAKTLHRFAHDETGTQQL